MTMCSQFTFQNAITVHLFHSEMIHWLFYWNTLLRPRIEFNSSFAFCSCFFNVCGKEKSQVPSLFHSLQILFDMSETSSPEAFPLLRNPVLYWFTKLLFCVFFFFLNNSHLYSDVLQQNCLNLVVNFQPEKAVFGKGKYLNAQRPRDVFF